MSELEDRTAARPARAPVAAPSGLPAPPRPELVPIPRDRVRCKRSRIQGGRGGPAAGSDEEVYVFPTSFDQERLFFVELLEPGSTYNVPMPVPFPGPVDVPALSRTIRELGRRHEALRTTLGYLERRPVQVVALESMVELEVMDLRRMPEAQRRAEAARLAHAHACQVFDLLRDPLWRAMLLRLADDDHLLLLNMHHAITDLWSTGLLVADLSAIYMAFAQGQPSPLPELPLQYGDYAAWQRQFLDQETLREQMVYWKRKLAAAPQVLRLPADRPRTQVQTVRGAHWMFPLGQELSERLMALCRRQQVTQFHCLLAGMAVLLAHSADVEDLLIGSPMSNRIRPGLEGLIGLFVNTVVLRVQPEARLSFNQLLRQVRATTLDAFDYQDMPLAMLIEEILEDRSASHSPLFQVMIAHQNDAMSTRPFSAPLAGDMGEGIRLPEVTGSAKYDLVLSVMESDRGLLGTWEYNVDLFEESSIQRLARRYRQLMEAAVDDPERSLGELGRRIAALDQAEGAAVHSSPAVAAARNSPPAPAPRAAPATVSPAPLVVRSGAAGQEAQARLDRLSRLPDAEVDDLLAEVVGELGEATVRAVLDSLPLAGPAPRISQRAGGDVTTEEARRLLARLDQLSDAEVDNLLAQLLSRWEQVA